VATWETLCGFINSRYPVTAEQEESVELRFSVDADRTQTISIVRREFGASEWIEITTPVCRADQIDPTAALTRNGSLTIGALALIGDRIVLKFPLRLNDLDPDEFDDPLRTIVELGDRLEQELTGEDNY